LQIPCFFDQNARGVVGFSDFATFRAKKSAYLSMELGEKMLNGVLEKTPAFFPGFFAESLDPRNP
jgi:hypothetical protein